MNDANSQTRMTHSCWLGQFVQKADFLGEEKAGSFAWFRRGDS